MSGSFKRNSRTRSKKEGASTRGYDVNEDKINGVFRLGDVWPHYPGIEYANKRPSGPSIRERRDLPENLKVGISPPGRRISQDVNSSHSLASNSRPSTSATWAPRSEHLVKRPSTSIARLSTHWSSQSSYCSDQEIDYVLFPGPSYRPDIAVRVPPKGSYAASPVSYNYSFALISLNNLLTRSAREMVVVAVAVQRCRLLRMGIVIMVF